MKRIFILAITIFIHIFFSQTCKKESETWYCPMHPAYTSDRAGQCPICNMSLVKAEKKAPSSKSSPHEEHKDQTALNTNSIEKKTLYLPEDKQALIGIKTAKAEIRNLSKTIFAYSRVAYDPELYTAILEYREA